MSESRQRSKHRTRSTDRWLLLGYLAEAQHRASTACPDPKASRRARGCEFGRDEGTLTCLTASADEVPLLREYHDRTIGRAKRAADHLRPFVDSAGGAGLSCVITQKTPGFRYGVHRLVEGRVRHLRSKTVTMTDVVDVSAQTGLADPAFDDELLAEGREQGYLTGERIADALQEIELAPDQLESLCVALADEGIEIIGATSHASTADTLRLSRRGQSPRLRPSL